MINKLDVHKEYENEAKGTIDGERDTTRKTTNKPYHSFTLNYFFPSINFGKEDELKLQKWVNKRNKQPKLTKTKKEKP